MNIFFKVAVAFALILAAPSVVKACEIVVRVEGVTKEKYRAGDTVVLKITVVLSHRNCGVPLDETKIRVSGSQITGATKWVNTAGRTWERKIKVIIISNGDGKAIITAERTCVKDGGKGSLTLLTDA